MTLEERVREQIGNGGPQLETDMHEASRTPASPTGIGKQITCGDCGWKGLDETWQRECRGSPCELGSSTPASPTSDDVVRRATVLAVFDESEDRWSTLSEDASYRDGYEAGLADATMWLRDDIANLPSPPEDDNWREIIGWKSRARAVLERNTT